MATLSFEEFTKGQPVSVVGNEVTQKESVTPPKNEIGSGLRRVADTYTKNLKSQFMGGLEHGAEALTTQPEAYANAAKNKDLGGLGIAAGRGGLRMAGGVAQSMFSPITAAIQTGIQGYQELDQATGGRVADKIKSIANDNPEIVQGISDYVAKNPEKVKDVEDILNFIGAKKIAPELNSLTQKSLQSTKEALTPIKTGVDAVKDVTGNITTGIAEKLTPDAEAIMQRVARIPKGKQASFQDLTGDSVGGFLDKRGIYGNTEEITTKLYDRFQNSKQTADDAIAELQGTYRATPVRTALTELEGKVERTSSPGAPDKDLIRVKQLVNKERTEGLTMSEINEIKRMYERRVRLDYLKTNAPEDVARATNVDNALREWQFREADKAGLVNLPEINKETQATKYLLDAIGKEHAGAAGNNALSLTDAIFLAGGDVQSIAGFLIKKGFSDENVRSWIASKVSKNINKLGVPEAQFKEKLQLSAPKEGQPNVSNEIPINLGKKSQSKADQELDTMIAKKNMQPVERKLQKPYVNNTPGSEGGKGIRGMVDPNFILRDLKGKFAGMADKFSDKEYNTMIDFLDYAHGSKTVSFDEATKLEEAAQKFLNDQGVRIPSTRSKLRDEVQKIIDESNFPVETTKKKVADSLEQEAKKYKSAEEFVKAQAITEKLKSEGTKVNSDGTVTLYHTTTPENAKSIISSGIFKGSSAPIGGMTGVKIDKATFFGTDKKWVEDTWGKGDVIEVKVPVQYIRKGAGNTKEVYFEGDLKKSGNIWIPTIKPQSTFYDKLSEMDLIDKSQLIDIWNKANGK